MNARSNDNDSKSTCIGAALCILGDKWTGHMLNTLTECPKTFSDLEVQLDGISPRTLSQRLEKLAAQDIIGKEMYCAHPPRYKYHLTDKGSALKKVLIQMENWGKIYS